MRTQDGKRAAAARQARAALAAAIGWARTACLLAFAAVAVGAALPGGAAAAGLVEEFDTDPFTERDAEHPAFERRGPQEAFVWDGTAPPVFEGDSPGLLLARYDSLEPTARVLAPLARGLGRGDDFLLSAVLVIRPEGFFADPFGFAQISFGLMNRATSGDDRTGDLSDFRADTFDTLEFDYFPNVSPFFGGPFAGAAAFGGRAGDDAFLNFAFTSAALTLPLGEPLEIRLEHRAQESAVEVSVLRIFADGTRHPLATAPVRMDIADLQPGFTLDAAGIFAYNDGFNEFAESGRSLRADVEYHRLAVDFDSPIPVTARILPDPLFVSTRARFARARLAPVGPDDAAALAALAGAAPPIELWAGPEHLVSALRAGYDPDSGELTALFDATALLAALGDARGEIEIQVRGAVSGEDRVFILGVAGGSGGAPGHRPPL